MFDIISRLPPAEFRRRNIIIDVKKKTYLYSVSINYNNRQISYRLYMNAC